MLDADAVAGTSTTTISHIRAMLLCVFKMAKRDGMRDENPVEDTETPEGNDTKKERTILTDDEFIRFVESEVVDPEIKLMAVVARILEGMRKSDVNRWDWAMVDRLHFERVIIPRQKTKRKRAPQELEVPPMLRPYLRARWEALGKPESGPVFPVQRGPRAGQFRATRRISYAKRLRRELLRAGIIRHQCTRSKDAPKRKVSEPCCERLASDPLYSETARTLPVDFHSFRRAFKTACEVAGVGTVHAMHLSGATDIRTHAGYVGSHVPDMQRLPEGVVPRLRGPGETYNPDTIQDDGEPDSSRATLDSNQRPSVPETDALSI